ncbi:MAG: UDP-N-acetylmuramoyl-tripeptide--D-alanyl-D-alanine ligase [Gammaproteobacteria bacterium]|nr:UDP-N-acetylmuramoyl-tripeptide--D-alanyl-D-alanine ligase [Gammaproteobacteria bacterium]MYE47811.1 UDP-N-acetylmuramoyl-tripeptide--D-alanyl-D-alanine ligase [Gammaproteobacteria bacterium]MYF66650.1 UDP-N-acetylmuramoyl-tripeptide--D-alanyl-D-alanine ligase [Gammaproteobacteria bacterium]MYK37038.1 UDP-N-acetylmuramoyl-tripeptide--D-alanyl-D-alanine ligase [Gammaproteobacteria bacterium]
MINGSLSEWATAMDGELLGPDGHFAGVSTDSRSQARGALFFALRGEHFDGADFLSAAISGGATGAVLSRPLPEDVPQIIVKDTRGALADCARTWRGRFDIPVIGVTGSNGKTTVKELTASILRAEWGAESVLASRRSFNNEIGLPLTLLDLSDTHNAAVLEFGASRPGDIASLSEIARPTIGAVLNASPAHLQGLGDVENVAREKGVLMSSLASGGVGVIPAGTPFSDYWQDLLGERTALRFGGDGDFRARNAKGINSGLGFELHCPAGVAPVETGLIGAHNLRNALAACALAAAAGAGLDAMAAGLRGREGVSGRLRVHEPGAGVRLIDDSYNANPASMSAAIGVLAGQEGERWLVVGDMAELGQDSVQWHRRVGEEAARAGIERLYCAGEQSRQAAEAFGAGERWRSGVGDLCRLLTDDLRADVTILVKGSRFMGMERAVAALLDAAGVLNGENAEHG